MCLGGCTVNVDYNGQLCKLPFVVVGGGGPSLVDRLPLVVVGGGGPSLVGRDWLCLIKLPFVVVGGGGPSLVDRDWLCHIRLEDKQGTQQCITCPADQISRGVSGGPRNSERV